MPDTVVTDASPVDVLHVSEAYGGGVQTAISGYIANSRELRHEIVVRVRPAHDVSDGIDTRIVRIEGSTLSFLRNAAEHVRIRNPRIVHLHSSFAGILRAFDFGETRVIYTPHSYSFLRHDTNRVVKSLYYCAERFLSRRPQVIAAISPHEVAAAARLAKSKDASVFYLPNVAAGPGGSFLKRLTVSPSPFRVITVGRISAQKDPEFFAKTVEATKVPDIEWVWVGDGDVAMRRRLIDAGVEVTGWVTNREVLAHLAGSDLYFHPARWEGAPITPLEASAIGTPVLAREIDTMTGLGFPSAGRTPVDAAGAIDRFASDPDYRALVTRETCHSTRIHSSEVQRSALASLYETAREKC